MRRFLLLTDDAEWRLGHYGNTFAFDMPVYCVLTGMQRRLRDNYGVRGMTWELEWRAGLWGSLWQANLKSVWRGGCDLCRV